MGYHSWLPCSMVFVPQAMGRVGLCNLWHKMEMQQVIILLCHLCAKTLLGVTIDLLLGQYQLWAGISQLVLVDTTPCPWIPDKWISHIWQTLCTYNMQIQNKLWVICLLHHNDLFLMEVVNGLRLSPLQVECINTCRMYLKVTRLTEIVNHMGTMLLPQILCCSKEHSAQGLDALSSSTLQWPCIHIPPVQSSWCLWTMMICNLFAGSVQGTKIHHPLGTWTNDYQAICK